MLIADIPKPVYLGLVLEQAQRNTMHRRVTPALVEEATRAVEMIEVVAELFAAPEAKVTNLKVGPEVTR